MKQSQLASLVSLVWILASCGGGSSFTSSSSSTGGQAANGGTDSQGGVQGTGGDQNTGGDTNGPPTSGAGGLANMTCDQLASAYTAELAVAKQCGASSAADRCTAKVKSSLTCGCDTLVNAARTGPIANLSKYIDAATARPCVTACPASACVDPTSASCSSSGSGSATRCVDGAAN